MSINIKQAKKILKEGLKDYTDENEDWTPVFEGDIPEDDKKTIGEAEELVELAAQAEESGQEHPAISKILAIDSPASDDDEEEEAGEEPWAGYDEEKVGKIVRGIADLDDDELIAAYEYEKANKNREPVTEGFEEAAAERGLEGAEDEPEEEDEGAYKPWKKYDEDNVKSILSQIKGMRPVKAPFWQKMLDYETENEDRARIKAEIEGKLEELQEQGDDVAEEPEAAGTDEEVLSWSDIAEMDLGELFDLVTEYEDDPDEILGDVKDDDEGRVLVAEAYELEIPSDDDEPEDEEEGITDDISWDVLEAMDLDELKEVIKEKDLGFRAGKKTNLDDLRLKIAEALDIGQPAPVPWRGYEGRDVKQVVKKLPKLDDDELKAVWAFESENAARKSIIKALEKIAEERGLAEEGDGDEEEEIEPDGSAEDGADDKEIDEAEEEDESKAKSRKARRRGKGKTEEPADDEPDYDALGEAIEKRIEDEHYAIPKPLPDNVSDMPFDLTELSETELRQLHSAMLNYFGRASYVAKVEKALAIACKNIADDYHDQLIATIEKIDPETEKDKSATQLKAEAEQDPTVRRWRRRERKHKEMMESMKADADIYKQNLDSLSRDWTMRIDEMDHSGGLGLRGKAGAKAGAAKKAVKKPPKKRG